MKFFNPFAAAKDRPPEAAPAPREPAPREPASREPTSAASELKAMQEQLREMQRRIESLSQKNS